MTRRKKPPAMQTIHMMEYAARNGIDEIGAADDLPLFSGVPMAVIDRPFSPQPVARQESLFDLRPDPFNMRKGAPDL